MDHISGRAHNKNVIAIVKEEIHKPRIIYFEGSRHKLPRFHPPSYMHMCWLLKNLGIKTSRGNDWTPKRLFRMLQRNGYSGLWGVFHSQQDYSH
ncbi:hypothetical protein [Psychrosphaera algicola]|uniref:Recombinase domain-containing protein n=1 Tax=Psychrosphaera algicola TaxID=3023714 RepID=A0ABT5FD56_9GAMM|nr:hypothetical protein [Psychrosphaera sp. G1-22]MDC2888516.1 hypothetical protein [Psychrosphaera sp. G1-22]